MKVLKTIIATAVIVFAATTVAMAGIQHLGGTDDATAAQPAQTATPAVAQPAGQGDVTLSAKQFATLLNAVRRDGAGNVDRDRSRTRDRTRTHTHAHQQSHTQAATGDGSSAVSTASHHSTSHDGATHHATTHTGTHDGGGHDGAHDGGTGGTHGGGCD